VAEVNLLLDTHLLLWVASAPRRLSKEAVKLIENPQNRLYFSAASIWEVVIKNGMQRADFNIDANLLRRGLTDNGYQELPITSRHTLAVEHLADIHKDPFDRILVAQAETEGFLLLTHDDQVACYPAPIRLV